MCIIARRFELRSQSGPDESHCDCEWRLSQLFARYTAGILDEVIDQQEIVIVRRKGARDVALIPASELAGIIETAHLLRSPRNASRLISALRRAKTAKTKPTTVGALRREILGGP